MDKIIFNGKIIIETPVHIGGSQEKHAVRGIDVIKHGEMNCIFWMSRK